MKNEGKFEHIVEQLSDENKKILCDIIDAFSENDCKKSLEKSFPVKEKQLSAKKIGRQKVAIICLSSLVILFAALFGGIAISKDFRYAVFNALEGDEIVSAYTQYEERQQGEEELASVLLESDSNDGNKYCVYISEDMISNKLN